jgi:hypothetical protein
VDDLDRTVLRLPSGQRNLPPRPRGSSVRLWLAVAAVIVITAGLAISAVRLTDRHGRPADAVTPPPGPAPTPTPTALAGPRPATCAAPGDPWASAVAAGRVPSPPNASLSLAAVDPTGAVYVVEHTGAESSIARLEGGALSTLYVVSGA